MDINMKHGYTTPLFFFIPFLPFSVMVVRDEIGCNRNLCASWQLGEKELELETGLIFFVKAHILENCYQSKMSV